MGDVTPRHNCPPEQFRAHPCPGLHIAVQSLLLGDLPDHMAICADQKLVHGFTLGQIVSEPAKSILVLRAIPLEVYVECVAGLPLP